jgi:hypothetical protein
MYEKEIFIYDPQFFARLDGRDLQPRDIKDWSPEYDIRYLQPQIENGATCLVFVNRLSDAIQSQNAAYSWIPFMPQISFTKDKAAEANKFDIYPHWQHAYLKPIAITHNLELPILQKLESPKPQGVHCDVFPLFQNGHGDALGLYLLRGRGALILLPRFRSNEEVIDTFLYRVMPQMYDTGSRIGLVEKYASPFQQLVSSKITELETQRTEVEEGLNHARTELATAKRQKANTIDADPTAKQVLTYYDTATRQDDVALFYLYKIIELMENKYGGEAQGIKALGCAVEWKHVKRSANESYGDIRHAPKPGDVVKKWTADDIKKCFEDTEKVILAFFATLFPAREAAKASSETNQANTTG